MFNLPDYTGRNPEYIKNSLDFFVYHAVHTLHGDDRETALESIGAKAKEWGVDVNIHKYDRRNDQNGKQ